MTDNTSIDPASKTQRLGADAGGVSAAAALLAKGRLVAFPTETVYGLGADARDAQAVAGIYAAKGRPAFNPLIVHVATLEAAQMYADLPDALAELAQAHWPGPLTLVAPMREGCGLCAAVTAGLPSVALRVPAHPVARAILAAFDGPVAAPSANPSGRISPTTADHVLAGLGGRIAAVVDGGACPVGLESTIVGMQEGTPVILRHGGVPAEALGLALGRPSPKAGVTAPGQLAAHYAPRAALRLNAERPQTGELFLGFGGMPPGAEGRDLSASGDLEEAAAALFGHLHALDEEALRRGSAGIAVAEVPRRGIGLAINDRLRRAAHR